ncbi:MAG: M55 family metallopeptidase [Planctomycetota bacterium]
MNIFVMVDMEGISGICQRSQVSKGDPTYARKYMTWDVNACVRGCLAGGAKKVTVRDAHGGGFNLIWEELDPRADYIQGHTGKHRMPGIERCDGLILLGYHAMAGTPEAILEHTMSSAAWQNCWLNGKRVGEVGIDAGIAGDYGVPTIMVSGDDKVCAEARRLIPGIVACQVKEGMAVEGGRLLPKEAAHGLIEKKSAEAVRKCKAVKPFRVKRPVRMRLEKVERGPIPEAGKKPYVKIIDGRTYEVTADSVHDALFRL